MLINFLKRFANKIVCIKPFWALKVSDVLCGQFQLNINRDLCREQKRVLICYLDVKNIEKNEIFHANKLHAIQMLKCFIDMGFCVDVCRCDNDFAYEIIKNRRYDIILGQGENFSKVCCNKINKNAKKILFVTECHPIDVQERYAKRLDYFKKRHSSISFKKAIARNGFFDAEMFRWSNDVIAMNSNYNIESMRRSNPNVFPINCNIIFNEKFLFDENIDINTVRSSKKNFLWFGSRGFIHKGADLVLDAFKEMPSCTLDFYGISSEEKVLFDKLNNCGAVDCGLANVQTLDFIENVVKKHSFLLFPSCSEGMSTAVATCMAHGIVPIITRETGFEPNDFIIELEDDRVETLKSMVHRLLSMSDEKVLELRKGAYNYAREHFSLMAFDAQFRKVMKEILNRK